jgi:tetratricopeptide (TPR) repeat protein
LLQKRIDSFHVRSLAQALPVMQVSPRAHLTIHLRSTQEQTMHERTRWLLERSMMVLALMVTLVVGVAFGGAHVAVAVGAAALWGVAGIGMMLHKCSVPRVAGLWLVAITITMLFCVPLPMSLLRLLAPPTATIVEHTYATLGTTVSFHPLSMDPPEAAMSLARLLGGAMLFVVSATSAASALRRRWLEDLMLACGAAWLLAAYVHPLLGIEGAWGMFLRRDSFLYAPLVNTNHLARFLGGTGLALLGIGLMQQASTRRTLLCVTGIALTMSILATSSRGAVVVLPAAAAVAWWCWRAALPSMQMTHRSHVRRRALWGAGALLVAASVPLWLGRHTLRQALSSLSSESLHSSKVAMYGPTSEIIAAHPMGIGPGAFAVATPAWQASHALDPGFTYTHVENNVLSIVTEYGVPAGMLFLLLVLWVCTSLLWPLPRAKALPPRARAVLPALVFLLLSDLLDFYLETPIGQAWLAIVVGYGASAWSRHDDKDTPWPMRRFTPSTRAVAVVAVVWSALFVWSAGTTLRSARQKLDQAFKAMDTNGDERAQLAREALMAHPADGHYAYELAVAARQRKDAAEALRYVELSLELAPYFWGAHVEAARAMMASKRRSQGMAAYRTALSHRADPDIINEVLRRFDSIEDRQQALPYTQGAQMHLLIQLKQEQRWDQAMVVATSLFEEFPDHQTASEVIAAVAQQTKTDAAELLLFIDRALAKSLVVSSNAWVSALQALVRVQGQVAALDASSTWSSHSSLPFEVEQARLRAALQVNDARAESILQSARRVSRSADDVMQLDGLEASWHESRSQWLQALRLRETVAKRNTTDVAAQLALVKTALQTERIDMAQQAHDRAARLAPGRADVVEAGIAIDEARRRQAIK